MNYIEDLTDLLFGGSGALLCKALSVFVGKTLFLCLATVDLVCLMLLSIKLGQIYVFDCM